MTTRWVVTLTVDADDHATVPMIAGFVNDAIAEACARDAEDPVAGWDGFWHSADVDPDPLPDGDIAPPAAGAMARRCPVCLTDEWDLAEGQAHCKNGHWWTVSVAPASIPFGQACRTGQHYAHSDECHCGPPL